MKPASIRFLAVVCLTLTCCGLKVATAQEGRLLSLKSSITGVQPMTGIVLWSDNEFARKSSNAISLEYSYCGYNEVVAPSGSYDWSAIEKKLDDIASRNHQAVLRFYFVYVGQETTVPKHIRSQPAYQETVGKSEKKTTHFCDWSSRQLQDFTLEFYTKFASRYDQDPRIAFLQTGFGLWAEYHIYDGPRELGKTFPSKQFQEKFIRHLNQKFSSLPWSISIDSADSEYSPLENNAELLSLQFGVFDDSFLCKSHPKENAVNWETLDSNRWKRQPGGGEFSYYNSKDQRKALSEGGPNGVTFEEAAKQFHISYMIGNDQPRYQTEQRIKEAGMATGYRFRVTHAAVKGNELRLRVLNEGVAPIYRDAFFAAGQHLSNNSLRGLLPGESAVFSIKDLRPADLGQISIQSPHILSTQRIEFEADLEPPD